MAKKTARPNEEERLLDEDSAKKMPLGKGITIGFAITLSLIAFGTAMYVFKATDDFYDYQKEDREKTTEMSNDLKVLKQNLDELKRTTREMDLESCIEFISRYESIRDALVVKKPAQNGKAQ